MDEPECLRKSGLDYGRKTRAGHPPLVNELAVEDRR